MTEHQFQKLMSVRWWEPDTAARLSPTERQFYEDLPWWQDDIRRCLPPEAIVAYEQAAVDAAVAEFPMPHRVLAVAEIADPVKRLRAADAAYKALRHASWQVAEVRREALLAAETAGEPTRNLADVIKTTTANVRQLVLKIKRDKNLPIRPAFGGPHPKHGRSRS